MKTSTFFASVTFLIFSTCNLFAQTVTVNITFQADMTDLYEQGFDPGFHGLELRGEFNDWTAGEILQPDPLYDSVYFITREITGVIGDTIEWKFKAFPDIYFVNSGWEIYPGGGGVYGNRQLPIPGFDLILDPVLPDIYLMETFIVNSTDDTGDAYPGDGFCDDGTGHCTLRAAIEEANLWGGLNKIHFDIPGPPPYTFQPFSAYAWIFQPILIDGTTEPDFAGTPIIELDGSNAGFANGLSLFSGESTIRGLVINRFSENGIMLTDGGNSTIEGNYIGTDISGTIALGNSNAGVFVGSPNNVIGGTTIASRNIISGNLEGITFPDTPAAEGNLVEGNFIGTDFNGTYAISNAVGILILSSGNTIGGNEENSGNLISGNSSMGIKIESVGEVYADYNSIIGNFIGTNVTGSNVLGNDIGINISGGASNNLIGGTTSDERNLISGNNSEGICFEGIGTMGNQVIGNFIGTNLSGSGSLANGSDGIVIDQGASNNLVGGIEPGAGNLISGNNRYGINIKHWDTYGNLVKGNFIGTDLTGNSALGNGSDGIKIFADAYNNKIGGVEGEENIIAFNIGSGILVTYTDGALDNHISCNSIFSNVEIGIDLSMEPASPFRDGVTPNDPGDPDTGPNNLQNFPEITTINIDGNGDLWIGYFVDSETVNSTYPISVQFFKADDEGEGQTFFGSDVFSEADFTAGHKSVNLGNAVELGVSNGDILVTTATDDNGNTSEFSFAITTGIDQQVTDKDANLLIRNYPNPFSFSTKIEFTINHSDFIKLNVYNTIGEKIQTLVNQPLNTGTYNVDFIPKKDKGGLYFYRLQVGNSTAKTGKMTLLH